MNNPNYFTDTRARHIRDLLKALWQNHMGLSRAELARRLELSRPAISNITQQLIDWGLLEESEMTASKGGRPGTRIRIVDSAFQILGLSLGSSHIQVQSMSLLGEVHSEKSISIDCVNTPKDSIQLLKELSQSVIKADIPLLGVGLSAPCPVHQQRLNHNILPKWTDIHLAQELRLHFQKPVFIDNDANLGALGELWWGHGRNLSSLLFIKLGTGIGAGIVSERRLIRGHHGYAGEIGHTFLRGSAQCRCGKVGCLEAYIGAVAIRDRLAKSSDKRLCLHSIAHDLASTITNLLNIVNPQGIVLWGNIVQDSPAFIDVLQAEVATSANWASIDENLIKASSIPSIIAMGASTMVLDHALNHPSLFVPVST